MRRWAIVIVAVTAAAGALVWRQTAGNPVWRVASLAGNVDQERLWKAASSAHTRSALNRLAASQPSGQLPTTSRQPPAKPLPQTPDSIPPNVATTIRIVSRMSPEPTEYRGRATVVSVDQNGERIVLQFATKREITVVARVAGKPLGVSKGDLVDVQLNWRPGHFEREHFIEVRTMTGIDVATMVRTGSAPVTIKTVLLTGEALTLAQVGTPISGSMALNLVLSPFKETIDVPKGGMGVGIERQYGARRIKVLGNVARAAQGPDGAPYGIDIITWQLP